MSEIAVTLAAFANAILLLVGYVSMVKFCDQTKKEVADYRTMTNLEIELLNQRIEGKNVPALGDHLCHH